MVETIFHGIEITINQMKNAGVWRDNLTFEEIADYAGKHIEIKEQIL